MTLARSITFLFLFAVLGSASACQFSPASPNVPPLPSAAALPTANTMPQPVTGAGFEGVILGDGAWTPDAEMIAALAPRLPAYLAQNQAKFNPAQPPIIERLAQYKFQYWGETPNGKRVIVVNAFCANFDDWKTRRVMVLDGGDCFFNLKYDVDSGTFSDLQVNGEA